MKSSILLTFLCLAVLLLRVDGDIAPSPTPPANDLTSLQGKSRTTSLETNASRKPLPGKACIGRATSRGVGSPLHFCRNGTEKNGALCYRPCSPGYHGVGPVCWKRIRSYPRGAGTPMHCGPEEEQNVALCYKACPAGYEGEGPVCWEETSPPGFPYRCNRVLYTVDRATCVAMDNGLIKAASFTGACVALAMVFAVTTAGMLESVASFFCGKSFDEVVSQVEQFIDMTHAKACSLHS